ncbi:MAG: hypothetical protein ACLVHV_06935 [Oscillospiraceae bacterium]
MKDFHIAGLWQSLTDFWFPMAGIILAVIFLSILISCLRKGKWLGAVVTCLFAAVLAAGAVIYRLPHTLLQWEPEDVSKVEISGVEVTDPEVIEAVWEDLGGRYRRTLPAILGGRQTYTIQVYDQNGGLLASLGIAGEDMVNVGGFWEQREKGSLNLDLYREIAAGGENS